MPEEGRKQQTSQCVWQSAEQAYQAEKTPVCFSDDIPELMQMFEVDPSRITQDVYEADSWVPL